MRKISTIVFDIGNVLLYANASSLYHKNNISLQTQEKLLNEILTLEFRSSLDKCRTTHKQIYDLMERYPDYADEILLYNTRSNDLIDGEVRGMYELLSDLDERCFHLYGLTNWPGDMYEMMRARKFPVIELLDDVVVSGYVGKVKPEPVIYQIAIQRYGLEPSETLFVDDLEANVRGAEVWGFIGHVFNSVSELEQKLVALGAL